MNNNYRPLAALIIGSFVTLLIWVTHIAGGFLALDGLARDALMRMPIFQTASEKLVVTEVEASYLNAGDEVWLNTLNTLLAQDAAQIIFTFFPERVSEAFYLRAQASGKVIFGHQLVVNRFRAQPGLVDIPEVAKNKDFNFGIISLTSNHHGIFRYQNSEARVANVFFPVLESLVADKLLSRSIALPHGNYIVNFIGGSQRLPKLALRRILAGGLIEELVKDKVVLIGMEPINLSTQLYTPLAPIEGQMSELLFHAFALDTLLSNRQIISLSDWLVLLLISAVTAGNLFLSQRFSFYSAIVTCAGFSAVAWLSSWLLLQLLFIWLPLVELLAAQWLSFSAVWFYRFIKEKRELDKILLDISVKLQEKVFPVSFYQSEDPWEQLIAMLNQTLHLERMIFLERVADDHRLKEIKALNCSINDIKEVRRDYEREPYSTAISENCPILLDKPYLRETGVDEVQYLAPLIFAGDVLGFWAFTIHPENLNSSGKFLSLTKDYMLQISEILHYRNEWQRQAEIKKSDFWRYLSVDVGNTPYQVLNKAVVLMEKRLMIMQTIFNSLHTSAILYDLFGRVVLLNKKMEGLARELQITPYNLSMLDFVVIITQSNPFWARRMLQQTIWDHKVTAFPVTLENQKSYMLYIRPLYAKETVSTAAFADESHVFDTHGVLCELLDVSQLKQICGLKSNMLEQSTFQLHNDLSAIVLGMALLKSQAEDPAAQQFILNGLNNKLEATKDYLGSLYKQINVNLEDLMNNPLEQFPIDAIYPLKMVLDSLATEVKQKNIEIYLEIPQLLHLIFASPSELPVVLQAILQGLIADIYRGGSIWITLEEKDGYAYYRMRNDGAGIPNDAMQRFISHDFADSDEMIGLHYAIRCVRHWGGSLDIRSDVGVGSDVELKLKCFI